MSFKTLRPQIKDLLDNNTKLQEVSGTPKLNFGGYPAAYVIPSDNSNDYETTDENLRTYAFIIRMFYETKNTGVGDAMIALEELTDEILDTFDQEDLKTADNRTVGVNLPSGYTYVNILANPASWGELIEEGLLMTELNVRVRISVDIT